MQNHSKIALALVCASSLTLISCADDTTRTVRLSSVGQSPASSGDSASGGNGSGGSAGGGSTAPGPGTGTGTGATGSGNIIVTGGNVLVGAAAQYAALTSSLNGIVPASGTVQGTVTAVLGASGHTLVELGNGTSVLLNGTGGNLGSVVTLNLGSGRVVGAPTGSGLIGLNVLAANPTTGSLATVNAASGGSLVGVTVLNTALGTGNTGTNNSIVISPVIAPALGLTGTGTLNAIVGSGH